MGEHGPLIDYLPMENKVIFRYGKLPEDTVKCLNKWMRKQMPSD
jgi:hypothetical protein